MAATENVKSVAGVGEQHPVHTGCRVGWRAAWDEAPSSLSSLLGAGAGFSVECCHLGLLFV